MIFILTILTISFFSSVSWIFMSVIAWYYNKPTKIIDFKSVLDDKERTIGIIKISKTESGSLFFEAKYLLKKYKIKTFKDEDSAFFYINLIYKKEKIENSVIGLKIPEKHRKIYKLSLSYN